LKFGIVTIWWSKTHFSFFFLAAKRIYPKINPIKKNQNTRIERDIGRDQKRNLIETIPVFCRMKRTSRSERIKIIMPLPLIFILDS